MAQHATADHLAMQLIIGGYPLTGLSDGESIRLAPVVQQFEMVVGNRGLGGWFKRYNKAFTIDVELMDSSDDNDILSRFFMHDLHTPGGVMFTLTFIDLTGNTRLISTGARVLSYPEITLGEGAQTRVWNMGTTKMSGVVGGRAPTPVVHWTDLPELADIEPVSAAV